MVDGRERRFLGNDVVDHPRPHHRLFRHALERVVLAGGSVEDKEDFAKAAMANLLDLDELRDAEGIGFRTALLEATPRNLALHPMRGGADVRDADADAWTHSLPNARGRGLHEA